jgi:hypothetical protein
MQWPTAVEEWHAFPSQLTAMKLSEIFPKYFRNISERNIFFEYFRKGTMLLCDMDNIL